MSKSAVLLGVLLCLVMFSTACAAESSVFAERESAELAPLPPPEPDGGPFGVDTNINMSTIDNFLGRTDVAYIDARMLHDPADFAAIGGLASLTRTLPGFRIVPFPFLGTLDRMPVSGAYDGITLFDIVWGENRQIISYSPNFVEAEMILRDLFPKDKAIFVMCGGAGYSAHVRAMLVHMGWDASKIYNVGGNWYYEGDMAIDLTIPGQDYNIATWRVDYTFIDFDRLTSVSVRK